MPPVFDGISLMDLPGDTLSAFFDSPNGLGWDESRGSLPAFLCGVLRNRLLMRLRRHYRWNGGSLDDASVARVSRLPVTQPQVDVDADVEEIISTIGDDPNLVAFVNAAIHVYDGGNDVNKQLGSELGLTPRQVVTLRKRLLRRLDHGK